MYFFAMGGFLPIGVTIQGGEDLLRKRPCRRFVRRRTAKADLYRLFSQWNLDIESYRLDVAGFFRQPCALYFHPAPDKGGERHSFPFGQILRRRRLVWRHDSAHGTDSYHGRRFAYSRLDENEAIL